jgi:MinD superfamily P-loop ATPase
MQEYVYYTKEALEFPLHESIYVSNNLEEASNNSFLISNTNETNSEVIADEISFYIKNSKESLPKKIDNIKRLYDIALIRFDNAKDFPHSLQIENKVLLIANEDDSKQFLQKVQKDEFDLFHIDESILKSIDGNIGSLTVVVDSNNKDVSLQVDQIVWFNAKEEYLDRAGVFNLSENNIDEVLKSLRDNIVQVNYKNFTTYDSSICQYHERREDICAKCEDVCPTIAIIKDETKRHLEFSHVDCLGCGGCVSVCPSGALDYAPMDKNSLFEIIQFYKDTNPLIIPNEMGIENLEISLNQNVFPFKIDGKKFLDEVLLLSLVQTSGSQVVFFSDILSKGVSDSIRILNEIYQKKYGKDAVLIASNEDELQKALDEVSFIPNSSFNFNQQDMRKREIFSYRLKNLVGDNDFGKVTTGPNIHYGVVKVNESKCTLCLSCVGACNVDALIADANTFELKINPSLCTSCGYCEVTCAEEDCLSIEQDVIDLNPMFFKENVLAKDTLFACIECGKEFATTKAIEKVATMMKPFFASNPIKERTLYCCEDCKAKLMIKQGLLDA